MSVKRFLSKNDHQRILSALQGPEISEAVQPSLLETIRRTLSKAKKLDPAQVPQDLITMNSKFVLKDLGNAEAFQFTLVYPEDCKDSAVTSQGKLSILSHHGSAVLGARVGEVVRWHINGSEKYLRVQELLYQPAAI
ncbi:transcription elongation factor GreAB [Leptospira semungkisensis]|uniref:Transcription elongation factor GreAB n=1 Tax=Leptospira semungkisensis TaxID=2484985 RepID=A0A4V3JCV6_9LEPT|nr:GreA/GreB family elongation factor [Leptospira semungkisensis]TGK07609.1 transcription elongation factor GreAB [Leptospira semungkisensis]